MVLIRVVIVVMRDDVCRILVHDIVVIAANHVTMRVSDNVIVMVNVIARVVMVVVRTVVVVVVAVLIRVVIVVLVVLNAVDDASDLIAVSADLSRCVL